MERGSSKHGPRLDQEMEKEVRGLLQGNGPSGGRAEEWHDPEPAGEDQPLASAVPDGERRTGVPHGMTSEEVEARSEFGRYLHMSVFPGGRDRLLTAAQEQHAPDWVINELSRLPTDGRYENVAQAWEALGHSNESKRW